MLNYPPYIVQFTLTPHLPLKSRRKFTLEVQISWFLMTLCHLSVTAGLCYRYKRKHFFNSYPFCKNYKLSACANCTGWKATTVIWLLSYVPSMYVCMWLLKSLHFIMHNSIITPLFSNTNAPSHASYESWQCMKDFGNLL